MNKYFFSEHERTYDTVLLTGTTAHHMLHVLRFTHGQEVILCNGQGTDFKAKLISTTTKPPTATFTLLSQAPSNTEPSTPIYLYQGLAKGEKMDWIIEKSIEAGVHKIIPVCTARSVAKIKDAAKKLERFTRIAEAAASQSMRGIIPQVSPPISYAQAVAECDFTNPCIVAYEKETSRTIKDILTTKQPTPVSIWIGPEGGFEENEIADLTGKGATPITLGPRILRTETAGLIAIAQILCFWE